MRGARARFRPPPRPLAAVAMLLVLPEASAAVIPRMLAPAAPELVPITPTVPSPCLPRMPCHWMPNCATLLAATSTIRLSTSTCARRPSSLSITARNWRYRGSGAVMMSELVVGSAWIWPPVDGWLLLVLLGPLPLLPQPSPPLLPPDRPLPVDGMLPLVPPPPRPPLGVAGAALAQALPPPVWPVQPLAPMAARSVVASLVASAFFRYTTWMLPVDALLPGAGAWSSCATSARTWAT